MGTWRITIEGHGCHHNGPRADEVHDANLMAQNFVEMLKGAGHTISDATFELTTEQREKITPDLGTENRERWNVPSNSTVPK